MWRLSLDTNGAPLDYLELDGVFSDDDSIAAGAKGDEGRAADVEVVATGDEGADLPTNPSVGSDGDEDITVTLVLAEAEEIERRDGDVGTINKRRPNIDLIVALVGRRDGGSVRDLLAPVDHVDFEAVVVNTDVVVRVARDERDLKIRSEEVRYGGVEGVDRDVLEGEGGFGGSKDCPYQKNCEQHEEEEHHYAPEHLPEDLPLLPLVVLALRHGLLLLLLCVCVFFMVPKKKRTIKILLWWV